ncbi:gypsy type transposase [Tanacetum coccineum]
MWGNYKFDFACSIACGRSGGLISIWDPNSFIKDDIWCDDAFIIVKGHWRNTVGDCYMINIYGPQDSLAEAILWNRIGDFMHQHTSKYIIFGDMNVVRNENKNSGFLFSRRDVDNFNSFIDNSEEVAEALPDVRVTTIDFLWSGHNLILLHVFKSDFGPTPFKLFHSWLLRDSFVKVIKTELPKLKENNFERKLLSHEKYRLLLRHSCSCVSDDLPTDSYDRNDVERLRARLIYLREMREEVLVHSGLKRVPSHTTAPTAEGAMISLPTPDEIATSLLDPRLAKKSKVPSQVRVRSASNIAPEPSRPSRNRKLKKRASEAGSSALELGQAEGMNEADSTNFYTEIENSLERDEGTSMRATSARTPRLGKRLCAPPSMVVVSASGPSHVGTSAHASTFGRSFSLGGATVSGHAGKSGVEVMRRQMDPLDSLAHSALARNVEHDQILKDDFGIATRGEEIDLTLFPLALGRVIARNLLQEKFDRKAGYVKVLRSEVTTLDGKLERMQKDCDALGQENRELCSQKDVASKKVKELQTELTDVRVVSIGLSEEFSQTDAKLSDQALIVRDLQNELALEKAKSQGYKDAVDGFREEVTRFFGSGVESLVRKLLSSDKFHVALAHVASLGINYGVERGLHIGRTDAEFEVAATPFPFLGKIVGAAGSTLSEVTQVLPDMHIRSVTSVLVAPPIANENANQVPLEHASDDSAASI